MGKGSAVWALSERARTRHREEGGRDIPVLGAVSDDHDRDDEHSYASMRLGSGHSLAGTTHLLPSGSYTNYLRARMLNTKAETQVTLATVGAALAANGSRASSLLHALRWSVFMLSYLAVVSREKKSRGSLLCRWGWR